MSKSLILFGIFSGLMKHCKNFFTAESLEQERGKEKIAISHLLETKGKCTVEKRHVIVRQYLYLKEIL